MLSRRGSACVRRVGPRHGTTLVELVVATALLGVVLAMLAVAGGRVQRVHSAVRSTLDARRPLRDGALVLSAELRELSGAAGDVSPLANGDTALALRTLVVRGLLCGGALPTLLAEGGRETVRAPEATDTLWTLAGGAAAEPTWIAWRIEAVSEVPVAERGSACGPAGAAFTASAGAGAWRLTVSESAGGGELAPGTAPGGEAVNAARVTRRARYSLYRGGDGAWQLGYREWDGAADRFQGIQPVSGAYGSAAEGGLRFFTTGADLPPGGGAGDAPAATVGLELRAAAAPGDLSGARRARGVERHQVLAGLLRR